MYSGDKFDAVEEVWELLATCSRIDMTRDVEGKGRFRITLSPICRMMNKSVAHRVSTTSTVFF